MFSFCFKQIIVLMILILSCSRVSFTKPLFLETSLPLDQIFNQQAPGQETQPQRNAFQAEESINKENDATSAREEHTQPKDNGFQSEESINQENVTGGVDASLDKKSAHNRTARDHGSKACFSHIDRKFDKCRQKFVSHVQCLNRHIACYQAINTYHYPKCKTVIGYRQIKFMKKCPPLSVGCQCAA